LDRQNDSPERTGLTLEQLCQLARTRSEERKKGKEVEDAGREACREMGQLRIGGGGGGSRRREEKGEESGPRKKKRRKEAQQQIELEFDGQ